MRKIVVLLYICLATALLAACAKKTTPTKSAVVTDEVAVEKGKYNAAQIAQGKIVYEQNCAQCHELHQPAEFNIAQWNRILPRMSRKAKLTDEQAGIVRAWVIVNAGKG